MADELVVEALVRAAANLKTNICPTFKGHQSSRIDHPQNWTYMTGSALLLRLGSAGGNPEFPLMTTRSLTPGGVSNCGPSLENPVQTLCEQSMTRTISALVYCLQPVCPF